MVHGSRPREPRPSKMPPPPRSHFHNTRTAHSLRTNTTHTGKNQQHARQEPAPCTRTATPLHACARSETGPRFHEGGRVYNTLRRARDPRALHNPTGTYFISLGRILNRDLVVPNRLRLMLQTITCTLALFVAHPAQPPPHSHPAPPVPCLPRSRVSLFGHHRPACLWGYQ